MTDITCPPAHVDQTTGAFRRQRRQQDVLNELAQGHSLRAAAQRAGVPRKTVYRWREAFPDFRRQADTALKKAEQNTVAAAHVKEAAYISRLRKSRYIPPKLRRKVMERDAYRCRYCGGYKGGLVLDHVAPFAQGGPTALDNLVTACDPCNSRKQDRTPEQAGMVLNPAP